MSDSVALIDNRSRKELREEIDGLGQTIARLYRDNVALTIQRDALTKKLEESTRVRDVVATGMVATNFVNVDLAGRNAALVEQNAILRRTLQHDNEIDQLKEENRELRALNAALQAEVAQLKQTLADVNRSCAEQMGKMQKQMDDDRAEHQSQFRQLHDECQQLRTALSAREIASNADTKLVRYVFAPAGVSPTGKPYHFRSFKNLKFFLTEQKVDENRYGAGAKAAFEQLPEDVKQHINGRLAEVMANERDVVLYIATAKTDGDRVAHNVTDRSVMLQFFDLHNPDVAAAIRALDDLIRKLKL